ncbi:MAG: hypothetical protein JXA39_03570 [Bacteroidales bacterium]|nr:hypothetical protein [Bacteroidales bacterium]
MEKSHSTMVDSRIARSWISEYKESDFSERKLSECMNMDFNKLALITRLLFEDPVLQKEFKKRWRGPYLYLYEQFIMMFKYKIAGPDADSKSISIKVEKFFDDKLTHRRFLKKLMKWDHEGKTFLNYLLKYSLREFNYRYDRRNISYREPGHSYEIPVQQNSEMVYERYRPILYLLVQTIDELPHKKLIFFYTTLFYSINRNINLNAFINNNFSDNMRKLYTEIYNKDVNEEFNNHLKLYYEGKVLKSAMKVLYNVDGYFEIVEEAGRDKNFERVVTSLFFLRYYNNYPDNPDRVRIRNLISSWNSRFKDEAEALLKDRERGIDLLDIMKDS